MPFFIKQIHVNQVLHLKNFSINLGNTPKHLLITGQNGSGKTQLLEAIAEHLLIICKDSSAQRISLENAIILWTNNLISARTESEKKNAERTLDTLKANKERYFGKVQIDFNDTFAMTDAFNKNEFILAFYRTFRNPKFVEIRSIEKPDLSQPDNFNHNKVDQFLSFLANSKVQAALARNEGNNQDAENFNSWFEKFTIVLRNLYNDPGLRLEFNYSDYSFFINSFGKRFKFTQLSAGYAAALDIIADLILRMQKNNSITSAYNMSGIAVIDEPETHLHLALQRQIMPILTSLFPNIQFIVATHSPFVLSSLPNAVAYDLEQRKELTDLTEYSYSALAEGYFGVDMESGDLSARINRLETLVAKEVLNEAESTELKNLLDDLETVSEAAAPAIKGRILEQKRKLLSRRT